MKKNFWLIIVPIALLLIVAGVIGLHYHSLPNYETPFKAENVMSVTVSTFWESKTIQDKETIENLITQLNKVKIISNYDENKDPIEAGTYGYTICFVLQNGNVVEYSVVSTHGLKYKFIDETGKAYSVRNIKLGKIGIQ